MPPDYISIRVLPEAKQAILKAMEPRETISDTIIRVCTQYAETRHDTAMGMTTNEWKQEIEFQIAELWDSVPRQISAGLEQIRETIRNEISQHAEGSAGQHESHDVDVSVQPL